MAGVRPAVGTACRVARRLPALMRVLHWFPNYFFGGGVANAVTGLTRAQADEGAEVALAGLDTANAEAAYGAMPIHPGVRLFRWTFSRQVNAGGLRLHWPQRR